MSILYYICNELLYLWESVTKSLSMKEYKEEHKKSSLSLMAMK